MVVAQAADARRHIPAGRWLAVVSAVVIFGWGLALGVSERSVAYVNGKIAFVHTGPDVPGDVFSINPDGTAATNLTNHPADDGVALWAMGGDRIAFTTNRDGDREIFAMNADGSGPINLTRNPSDDDTAAWSPDNSKIAFDSDRGGDRDVYIMRSDGTGQTNLTNNAGALDAYPYFSPDGTKLSFTSDRDDGNADIYTMNVDGTGQTNLTDNPAHDTAANYSPDGTKIAFMSDRDGDFDVYVMNADGSDPVNVTDSSSASDGNPNWSPDGKMITFNSNREGNYDIFVMNADGTGQQRITSGSGDDILPDWARLPESTGGEDGSPIQDPCAASLRRPLVSVTHWKRLVSGLSARIKVAPGGFVIRPGRSARFVLQRQRAAGRPRAAATSVEFRLDGVRVAVDRRAPHEVMLAAESLTQGGHLLTAVVRGRGIKRRVLRLSFIASNCESAAFSASMINKVPRKHTDLELRAQTGGPALTAAEFRFSPRLRLRLRGLGGRRIGTLRYTNSSGQRSKRALTVPQRLRRTAELVAGDRPRLALKRGRRARLLLTSLEGLDVTKVRIVLFGRRTGLLQNPARCVRHRYRAALESATGKLTLNRSLQMCKGRLGRRL